MGSRVTLTSRSNRVSGNVPFIRELRLLSEKESWILLREKVFGENSCPPELEEVGKKIAKKCDGLPLTIITVADLLLKIPESCWIDVAAQRKHQIFIEAYDAILKVLYPSYEDLPQQLKLCFLYMGVFPPNYKIPRSRLINMWYVEELLGSEIDQSLEECADEYLEEFSSNSLVMVYLKRTRSSLGLLIEETKSCGLHSSWWHLCYTEARKNDFFYVLISRDDRFGKHIKGQSRLSIHNNVLFAIKDVHSSIEKNSAYTARSLLCLGPYHQYPVPICFGLRYLINLDALSIRLYEFPLEVLKLCWLKYLALACDGELPASISKLHSLKFFIVTRHQNIKLRGASSYLPVEIWDMEELEHLQIMGRDLPNHLRDTDLFPNLLTLLDVSDQSCTKGIFERIPNLRKLGIRIELALDAVEPFSCFDHIPYLNKLESFKCVVVNPAVFKTGVVSLPTSISIFPLCLKKLTLDGLNYPWKEASKIALPCLEVLKLRCNALRGPKWEVEENRFRKLRFLIIEDSDLVQWKVGRGSFKVLMFITIKHCYKLKKVQLESEVELLGTLEAVDCDPSLEYIIREALLRQRHVLYNVTIRYLKNNNNICTLKL